MTEEVWLYSGVVWIVSAGTLSLDATLMSWVLTVLIMIFMFSAGLAIVSFPWMFMGKLSIIS